MSRYNEYFNYRNGTNTFIAKAQKYFKIVTTSLMKPLES